MKTTEIFVEQVLIGLLVLATGFLPYIHTCEIKKFIKDISLADGALIVAIAYLLGIGLDRFADTLISRLEKYYRLKFAIELISRGKEYSKTDPFPEDCLRIEILKEGKDVSEWMHYLRSRIRLSRALAIFTPALTISGLLLLSKNKIPLFLGLTALFYVGCLICIWILPKVPKTFEIDNKCKNFNLWREPTTIAAGLLFVMMTFIAGYYHPTHACVVLITGVGISALSAWSWWRISQTYMQFLMDFKKCEDNNAPQQVA